MTAVSVGNALVMRVPGVCEKNKCAARKLAGGRRKRAGTAAGEGRRGGVCTNEGTSATASCCVVLPALSLLLRGLAGWARADDLRKRERRFCCRETAAKKEPKTHRTAPESTAQHAARTHHTQGAHRCNRCSRPFVRVNLQMCAPRAPRPSSGIGRCESQALLWAPNPMVTMVPCGAGSAEASTHASGYSHVCTEHPTRHHLSLLPVLTVAA
jgi:hypothetical protein